MANVLPLSEQKSVWKEARARIIICASIMLLSIGALAALLLIPSYLALSLASPASATIPAKSGSADIVGIGRAQALVTAAYPLVSATTSPMETILAALSEKPAGVVVNSVSYTKSAGTITLSGSAPRAALNAYRTALQGNPSFTSVDVPVGSLVAESGSFSITLAGHF